MKYTPKKQLVFFERHPKLYAFLFNAMNWYAIKVLKIPFTAAYNPVLGNERKLRAITYSWDLQYTQALKDNWELLGNTTKELEQAHAEIDRLQRKNRILKKRGEK